MKRLAPWVVAALVGLSVSRAGAGPELGRAKTALDDLRYEDAAQALDEALRAGDQQPEDVREIYRLLGEVAAALGERSAAVEHFERLLALDPDATLREGVSPKIEEPFEAARGRAGDREPLGLRCEVGEGAIEVTLTADPLDMARGAYLAGTGGYETAELDGGEAVIVATDTLLIDAVGLLDEHGNRLIAVPFGECGQEMVAPTKRPDRDEPSRDGGGSIIRHWALWGGVAVGFAAAGTYFGLESRDKVDRLEQIAADSSEHEFSEAQALEDDARRDALFANIGFGAAGAAAVVSAILLVRSATREPERDPERVVVTPTAGRAGVGVSVAVPF